MANLILRHGVHMRDVFNVKTQEITSWFPGHMAKGLNKMQQKLAKLDCIIEVHDARIPISGRNPRFNETLSAVKPHVLMLNKMDLADMRHKSEIIKFYENQGIREVIFTNCKKPDSAGIKKVIPIISRIIHNSDRYNRSEDKEYHLLIIGVPNVGKSSLINALRAKYMRKSRATPVGNVPGITKSVLERIKVCHSPSVYLIDTPGILSPKIPDVETGLKLALVGTIKDHLVGEEIIADYLLYRLNKNGNHSYVSQMLLDAPCDNIQEVLIMSAIRKNYLRKSRGHDGIRVVPNLMLCASQMVMDFRAGKFGPAMLDSFDNTN